MRKLAWMVGLALSLLVASAQVGVAQIIGDWTVDNMTIGAGQTLSFRPNGTYEYKIWRILPGRREVIQAEVGTYKIQRDRVTLEARNGTSKSYRWRFDRGSSPILFLRDDSGVEQQFYSQASDIPGKKDCGQMFADCNIAGKPYSYCQQQFEACNAARR
jgi:hypothetical protein